MSDVVLVAAIVFIVVGMMLVENAIEYRERKPKNGLDFYMSLFMAAACLIVGFLALGAYLQ